MNVTYKRWAGLGLGAALATTTALTACSPTEPESAPETAVAPAVPAPAPVESAEPAPVSGEGEGGVPIEEAVHDPVVYGTAIAVAKAHVLAARDAFAEGEHEAAAEMFAHPVSEVLADMAPVFEARGVEDFNMLLINASGAVYEGETADEIAARTDEILATLEAANDKAPDDGSTPAEIATGVVADMIDRATAMYRMASESEYYEPYLDGYGFYETAKLEFEAAEAEIEAANADGAAAIREALALLGAAYPTALRPEVLDADQSALTVAASNVALTTS